MGGLHEDVVQGSGTQRAIPASPLHQVNNSETGSYMQKDSENCTLELSPKKVRKTGMGKGINKPTVKRHLKPLQIQQGAPSWMALYSWVRPRQECWVICLNLTPMREA